jgi:hypothetical protein
VIPKLGPVVELELDADKTDPEEDEELPDMPELEVASLYTPL